LEEAMIENFCEHKAGLGTEQLLFNTTILITPRTWCKAKQTNFYKIWAA
jgi:hypothetical protein